MSDKPIDLGARRLADAVLMDMGVEAAGLAAIAGGTPGDVRDAILDGVERAGLYAQVDRQRVAGIEAAGERADRCFNSPCEHCGDEALCSEGAEFAVGCVFRMSERPPSNPFAKYPSHAEAVRMLQRAGLCAPDDFGEWSGTDFAFRQHVGRLWWAYVSALHRLGEIPAIHPERPDQGCPTCAKVALCSFHGEVPE